MRRNSHGGIDSGYSTHALMRVPSLLVLVFGLLCTVIGYYVIRVLIHCFEFISRDSRCTNLLLLLRRSTSYREWRYNADRLSKLSTGHRWRLSTCSDESFQKDLEQAILEMGQANKRGDCYEIARNLMRYLNSPLTSRVFRIDFHRRSWLGTKRVIEMFISELVNSVNKLSSMMSQDPDSLVVVREVLYSNSFGKSALCLSGGGTMGLQHIGVIRALSEHDIVPNIVSGTSAGSIVAAAYCVRLKTEVDQDFSQDFLYTHYQSFWNSWSDRLKNLATKGYMFDQNHWRHVLGHFTLGDTTFLEAYTRTGKVLNVSTTARHTNINFNYITSPNVVISSACIASCAMPTFFGDPIILEKNPVSGEVKEVRMETFADGSLAGDVPAGELRSLFGVRFVITSQVNPHITPFIFYKKGEPGDPVCLPQTHKGGVVLATMEGFLKRQMQALLRVIQQTELELSSTFRLSRVYLQDFHGNITLWSPNDYLKKVRRALDKVESVDEYDWWVQEGEKMTWPKIRYIQTRMLIENALQCLEKVHHDTTTDLKSFREHRESR